MQKGNDFDLNIEKILLGIVYTKKFMILLFFLLGLFRALVIILLIMLLCISFSVFLTSKVHTHDEWECKWYFQFAGSFNEIEYQWHYCTQYERELPNYVEVDFPSNVHTFDRRSSNAIQVGSNLYMSQDSMAYFMFSLLQSVGTCLIIKSKPQFFTELFGINLVHFLS